jgi:hypothetical protein
MVYRLGFGSRDGPIAIRLFRLRSAACSQQGRTKQDRYTPFASDNSYGWSRWD